MSQIKERAMLTSAASKARRTKARFQVLLTTTMATVALSGAAIAQGSVGQAIITGIAIDTHDDNMAFISVNVAKTDNPACSTSAWAFVLPLTTPLQNLMFSQLLAARTTQRFVSLSGSGLCDTYASVETLTFVNF
jgi:hypothetical protein